MASKLVIEITGKADDLDKTLKGIEGQFKSFENRLAKISKVSGLAFAGFTGVIGFAAGQAAKIETLSVQFETLTGSAAAAAKVMEQLQQFAARTPFQLEGLASASSQLLAFGFEADQLIPKLKQIGDVASASGNSIQEVATIFGQVAAAGKLTGERLQQFQERAIPILDAIAAQLNKPRSAIRDLVTQGKVDFATFEKAFESLSEKGGIAFNGMEKQSKTLAGVMSTLGDNFTLLAAEIGKQFVPVIKAAADGLSKLLEFAQENPVIVKLAAVLLAAGAAATGLVFAVSTGVLVFSKFVQVLTLVQVAVTALGISMKALAGATVIGALVVAISYLATNWEKSVQTMAAAWVAFKTVFVDVAKNIGGAIVAIVTRDFEGLKSALVNLKNAFTQDFSTVFKAEMEKASEASKVATDSIVADQGRRNQANQEAVAKDIQTRQLNAESITADLEEQLAYLGANKEETLALELQFLDRKIQQEQDASTKLNLQTQKNQLLLKAIEEKGAKARTEVAQKFTEAKLSIAENAAGLATAILGRESKAAFLIEKAVAIGRAIVATNLAVAQAEAIVFPPGLGHALAVQHRIAGGLAIAAIVATAIQGFADGGLVQGGIPGIDSVPALLQPGELVVPARSYDDVVNAVADQRTGQGGGGGTEVVISLKGDAAEIFETQVNRRRVRGLSTI